MRKEVVWEEVCKATTFLCSIAQKLPSFFFFFSYRSRLGLWQIRSRGYWEKEHGERNGTWVSGTNGTVTEWTSELRHFIILAVFLKKALARFTL